MSLNFGFSLPALLKYGIGGFDPFNQSGPTLDLVFAGTASEMLSGGYTLDTNFIVPQYEVAAQYSVWENGVGMAPKTFSDIVTFTRASSATLFDSTGTLVFAPMNAIRNNTMQGAVAGTPGTLPTNWGLGGISGGLATQVVGTGIESGITYIDVRIFGTNSSGSSVFPGVFFDTTTGIAGATGQVWAESVYLSLVAGTGVTFEAAVHEQDSGGFFLRSTNIPGTSGVPTVGPLDARRRSGAITLGASTAFVRPLIATTVTNGTSVDFTLRIGMPQLERGSTATAVNATSGTAYQGPRFDYDPSTLAARGLLIEEQRTNSIRNNTMQGAVAGTPGTAPTGWFTSTAAGITRELVGTGTENGITYIDYRFSGTATGSSDTQLIAGNLTPAVSGQTWTFSNYAKIVAGSLTNVTVTQLNNEYDSAGNFLAASTQNITPTTAALGTQRFSLTRTFNNASTQNAGAALRVTSAGAIDITLRIGLPQLELGAFATSVIPTTTTATTRSADVASVNTLTPWYNQAEGTLYAESSVFNPSSAFSRVASIENSSNISSLQVARNLTDSRGFGDGVSITQGSGTFPVNTIVKQALAGKVNDFALSTNGSAVATDTSTNPLPTNVIALGLGASIQPAAFINGYLRRITYYPRRMPNAQLQTITT